MKAMETLIEELAELGPEVIGDCSIEVILSLDQLALARAFGSIARRYEEGIINEQEARLFARLHWIAAALRVTMAPRESV